MFSVNLFSWQAAGPWTERIWNSCRPSAKGNSEVRNSCGSLRHFISHVITETKVSLDIILRLHLVSVLVRCDGGRLQRDQGGSQVYQKWCHSASLHRWGLCHDVRSPPLFLCPSGTTRESSYGNRWFVLLLFRCLKATEAQQPGAIVGGNCWGARQSLHRHRVHG